MKNRLSVIIPFLNENIEIENTLQSIRSTAGDTINILIINDCSTDEFDYESIAVKYNAHYHKNEERLGVASSRDLGVSMIDTPYFLLLDGHMRFFQNDWVEKILNHIQADERAVYCLQCKSLLPDATIDEKINTMGACINIEGKETDLIEPYWKYNDTDPDSPAVTIPCVLGACYVAAKTYWDYLRGLEGLHVYGSDEPFISLKTWLEGGKCILLKEIIVGHFFRKKHPFVVNWADRIYNRLLLAELLLPLEHKKRIFSALYKCYPDACTQSMSHLVANKHFISESKQYFQKIFTCDFDSFLQFNRDQGQ